MVSLGDPRAALTCPQLLMLAKQCMGLEAGSGAGMDDDSAAALRDLSLRVKANTVRMQPPPCTRMVTSLKPWTLLASKLCP